MSYPPSPLHGDDDIKVSYDEDIIENYTQTHIPSSQIHLTDSNSSSVAYPAPAMKSPRGAGQSRGVNFYDAESGEGSNVAFPKEETRGFIQTILPDSLACRLYVLTVLIETAIDLAVEADLFVRLQKSSDEDAGSTRRLPVYLSIFALAHLFQFVMAIDAVYARNTLQFLFLTFFNALFLVYAVIQISEIRKFLTPGTAGISDIPVQVLTTIIPIVISVAEVAYIALGWKIWTEFGWKVYKYLGADRRIKKMYARYQIFVCLVKFDVFFFVGFSVQLIWLVLNRNDWEWYVTCAALPLSFLLLVEGVLAARKENKHLMWIFMGGCIGAMVYFVYKLYKIFTLRDEFDKIFKSLTTFAVIAILLLFATFVMAWVVLSNFGGGLKDQIAKPDPLRRRGTRRGEQAYPMGAHPNRMSID